ncbi:dynein regulatory complex subunit 2 [Eupeodes corollae]|uniref:dynein regulatory complex subunit 2 n=1 Tax=Eupeodes corollae TaxID=290404 RepID=UPI00249200F8|nr:dynein regulatory complex subunit 2 [Eupeodes corollae]
MGDNVDEPTTVTEAATTKKKKKPKMSKEEKKRLRLLAAVNLKKRLMKEQLIRELEMTKKSMKLVKIEWEKICSDIKVEEFREEIKKLSAKTEQILEKKDEKIEMLIKNIDETQEMHLRSFSQHLDQLEYLTDTHQTLRETAAELYNHQASDLIQEFFDELSIMQEVPKKIKLNNENIIHNKNNIWKKRLKENHELFIERKFEETSVEIENRYIIRDGIVKKMNLLHKQLLNFMKELQGNLTDVRKTENYLNFMQRQRNYVVQTDKLNEMERVCLKTIAQLRQELLHIESELNRKMCELKAERDHCLKLKSNIKASIESDRKLIYGKMLKSSNECYKLKKKLKEFVKQGELLLSLAACCRKYQTEKEKVIPFQASNEDLVTTQELEQERQKMNVDIAKLLDVSEEELSGKINMFTNFWRRCSDVKFHNLLLEKEKLKLTEENEKYRNIIRSMNKSENVEDILEALKVKQL